MSQLSIFHAKATTISDAWHQLVLAAPDNARLYTIDKGSYEGQQRLEFDSIVVQITHPEVRPFEPDLPAHLAGCPNPVEPGYIEEYLPYLMTSHKEPDEDYTYGERLMAGSGLVWTGSESDDYEMWTHIDQVAETIRIYKEHGHRNNQLVLRVSSPIDIILEDPPCLQIIDTRIQDDKLHFHVYFRSWDLWGGFPANLGAIQMLKEYMAEEIEVDPGETIAYSKGAHYYGYVVPYVLQRGLKPEDYLGQPTPGD
jgi:thymidylate synthase